MAHSAQQDSARSLATPASRIRVVTAAVIGNGLEFFDFTILSFFVTTIGPLYFPGHSVLIQSLAMLSVIGVAYFMRPLGGLVLGVLADRRGRKIAMLWTLSLMTLGTVMVGLIPPYSVLGPLAPCLMVTARLIQGFAAGGEIGVTTAYLVEIAPQHRRGFWSGWQFVSQGVGVALGGMTSYVLIHSLCSSDFVRWGWRVPFLLGFVLLPIGVYVRRNLEETLDRSTKAPSVNAAFKTLGSWTVWPVLLLGCGVVIGQTVTANLNLYMVTYAQRTLNFPASTSMLVGLLHGVILLVAGPFFAWCSDYLLPRNRALIATRLVQTVVVFCSFWWFTHAPSLMSLILGSALMSVMFAASVAGMNVLIIENLPAAVRTTGYSLVNSVTVALFGGLTQPLVQWAIGVTNNPLMPAWFIAVAAVISIVALWFLKDKPLYMAPPVLLNPMYPRTTF